VVRTGAPDKHSRNVLAVATPRETARPPTSLAPVIRHSNASPPGQLAVEAVVRQQNLPLFAGECVCARAEVVEPQEIRAVEMG
jgi:hypothetical protein